jgi:RNA polymerase sigma factor (sigma-70 family)
MNDPELYDWIKKYKPLLKSIAAKEIDRELVQKIDDSDVIQETLHAARVKFEQVEPKNSKEVRGYLRRIMISKIQDLRRRFLQTEKRDVRREASDQEVTSDEIRQIVGVDGSPLETLIDEEHFRRVMSAVQALPTEIQTVLSWRFEHDMTFEQIGNKIGRTKDDVRMLIQRCIARLKKQLEDS